MRIVANWLGISVIVLALAQFGKAVCLALPTGNAPELDIVHLVPGGSEELSAWVVEPTTNEPIAPTPPASTPFASSSTESWRSVANRNRNPLNIKLGSETRRYLDDGVATISDIIPKDGGRFLRFDSPETGFRVAVELLSTPPYHDGHLDRALRRWSNNGFGAEILAGTQLHAQTSVPYLGRDDLEILLNAMAAAEGYKSSTIADEIRKALRPSG